MNPPLRIELLADYPEVVPELLQWFETDWIDYYGPDGPGDAEADLASYSGRDALPIGLVAFRGDLLCGFAALKVDSIPAFAHLTPWAGAGLVPANLRRQGIGRELLRALEELTRSLGYPKVYCATSTSESLLIREGWSLLERVEHDGVMLGVFEKSLSEWSQSLLKPPP